MINEALTCVTNEMNAYFNSRNGLNEEQVVLSALIKPDGASAINTLNKVIITLVNIEADTTAKNNMGFKTPGPVMPPLQDNLNLCILLSANYISYNESLRFIDDAVVFLLQKSVFFSGNTPGLDETIEKMTVQMVNLPLENVQQLWLGLGAKYLPSAVFKIRVLLNPGQNG
jgi:hypothetical protein